MYTEILCLTLTSFKEKKKKTAVCKSSFFHLRNIFKIRKFLSYDTCKTLIHAFVTARIDYCNSLLYGQPKCILKRLQSVLNSAARLIHLTSRCEHVFFFILFFFYFILFYFYFYLSFALQTYIKCLQY